MNTVPDTDQAGPVVELDGLTIDIGWPGTGRAITRVGPVDLSVDRSSCLGIVGRSGAGKSTLALALLGMLAPEARVVAGAVRIAGESLFDLRPGRLREVRGGRVAMIFQDPASALNPVRRLDRIFGDVIRAHNEVDGAEVLRRSEEALVAARLDPAVVLRCYPHELSGGMRQRVVVALAVVNRPDVLVADEPTTALDPTIALEILDLLGEVRRNNTLIVITHDLRVARRLCDRVAVMHDGRVVEHGECSQVFSRPGHQVTRMLLGHRNSTQLLESNELVQ